MNKLKNQESRFCILDKQKAYFSQNSLLCLHWGNKIALVL